MSFERLSRSGYIAVENIRGPVIVREMTTNTLGNDFELQGNLFADETTEMWRIFP